MLRAGVTNWRFLGIFGVLGLVAIQCPLPPIVRSLLAVFTGVELFAAGVVWEMARHLNLMITLRAAGPPSEPLQGERVPGTPAGTARAFEAMWKGAKVSLDHETGEWTIGPIPDERSDDG